MTNSQFKSFLRLILEILNKSDSIEEARKKIETVFGKWIEDEDRQEG